MNKWRFEPEFRNEHNPKWTRWAWDKLPGCYKEPRSIEECSEVLKKALDIWIEGTEFRIVLVQEEAFSKVYKKKK